MRLRFSVADTGIGLSDDEKASIFMPFTQADASTSRRFGGTGLGLSICHRLIDLLGGEISVKDNPGGGSIFWFSLDMGVGELALLPSPEENQQAEVPLEDQSVGAGDPASVAILVAEDNPINQLVLRDMLAQLGMDCTVVVNGQEAVKQAEQVHYALILMDCQMPEMDGFEASRIIRQQGLNQKTPIVAITANALKVDQERCFDAGMNDYLSKPLLMVSLSEKIMRYIRLRGD
jgi:CheY-like chemotaxis protein